MEIINENKIQELIKVRTNQKEVLEILKKAEKMKGLKIEESAKLLSIDQPELLEKVFLSASKVKMAIYGPRLVLFAPLYGSSYCVNDCEYCAFHSRNQAPRKKLTLKEVKEQVEILESMGHKRLLLEFGEDPQENPIDYVIDVIKTVYATKKGHGEIRRVNVNIAATSVENYRKLKKAKIGTYQLFQETFHRPTYEKMHHGPKADYDRQITAIPRAFAAGIDDLGIGVLFGLYDYRFDALALIEYAKYLDKTLGVGPHTISVPRLQPAQTVDYHFEHLVSDQDFLKIIAVLRLSIPYTGMIISTRESVEIRRKAFAIGISQASAGSRTAPGGYKKTRERERLEQFHLNDHRCLDEVVQDICRLGYLPSFCTACYRSSRTGERFMTLAKSGKIHNLCQPNALTTFAEYLMDFAKPVTRKIGEKTIAKFLALIPDKKIIKITSENLKRIREGKRDLYL